MILLRIYIPSVENMNVYSYNFNGYWRGINTVEMYYRANMELLNPEIYNEIFQKISYLYKSYG